jgi:hypothetical protein
MHVCVCNDVQEDAEEEEEEEEDTEETEAINMMQDIEMAMEKEEVKEPSHCCVCFSEGDAQASEESEGKAGTSSAPIIKLYEAGCGAQYCRECLVNAVRMVKDESTTTLKCMRVEHNRAHDFEVTQEMGVALKKEGVLKDWVHWRIRRGKNSTACPACSCMIVHGNCAKLLVCTQENCVNPIFGYCVECTKAVNKLPHMCVDPEEKRNRVLLIEYLAKKGVHPCPSCHEAAEKDDPNKCNHMTCRCGCYYCAACGFVFKKMDANEYGYRDHSHNCVSGSLVHWTDEEATRWKVAEVYQEMLNK